MRHVGLILLAAGGSTRMKTPKPLLPWGDETLLSHAVKTALKTSCRPVIVVLGCESEACRQSLASLPVTIVVNQEWRKGMGTSVSAGIIELESGEPDSAGALLMLVDQPKVSPELLETLITSWAPPDFPISATSYGERGGVPALFDRRFFPELRHLDSNRGARDLIARERNHTKLIFLNGAQADLDTEEDYRAASTSLSPKRLGAELR
jgi:molybdenum cofactor cytidylyltransferase